jgi:hypothetical protein
MIKTLTIKGFSLVYFKILITNKINQMKHNKGRKDIRYLKLSGNLKNRFCMGCIRIIINAAIIDVAIVR